MKSPLTAVCFNPYTKFATDCGVYSHYIDVHTLHSNPCLYTDYLFSIHYRDSAWYSYGADGVKDICFGHSGDSLFTQAAHYYLFRHWNIYSTLKRNHLYI